MSDVDDYAAEVCAALCDLGLRAETDLRNETINYKIRQHSNEKVPVILVVGKREAAERTVNLRRLGVKQQEEFTLDAVVGALTEEVRERAMPPGFEATLN